MSHVIATKPDRIELRTLRGARVLVTGAAGEIGHHLRSSLAGRYGSLRLTDVVSLGECQPGEELVQADLADAESLARCVEGVDAIIHLGGIAREGEWDRLVPSNIIGAINLFEQARLAGVKRVVFASSNHVIGYHRANRRIGADIPVRPDTRYGVTKVFGEALGRYMADKHGMEVICLRIGSFRQQPTSPRELATWLSPDDMTRLAISSLEATDVHFEIVYGISANTRRMWEDDGAGHIGYRPQDDAQTYVDQVRPGRPDDVAKTTSQVSDDEFHGGFYAALDCVADVRRID